MASDSESVIGRILLAKDCRLDFNDQKCSRDGVKEVFQRLARIIHPDKTSVPGAAEAFAKLRTTYEQLLCELEKKMTVPEVVPAKKATKRSRGRSDETTKDFSSSSSNNNRGGEREAATDNKSWNSYKTKVMGQLSKKDSTPLQYEDLDCNAIDSNSNKWKQFKHRGAEDTTAEDTTVGDRVETNDSKAPLPSDPLCNPNPTPPLVHICLLCRRGFQNGMSLDKHFLYSEMHKKKLEKSS